MYDICMLALIAGLTFISTFLGGLFALKFKDKLHLVLGFSAGAVIGVAFFDLIPESLELASGLGTGGVMGLVAFGFLAYMLVDRSVSIHSHHDYDEHCENENHHVRGSIGASSFSIHSFIDGIAVGFAFQASSALGILVAVAVLAHDFSDGINTVNVVLKNGGTRKQAFKWLFADSLAPVLGIISTLFFSISEHGLGIILSIFCGFFLYLGASDLLPESHHRHPTLWTSIATIAGVVVLYLTIGFAGV